MKAFLAAVVVLMWISGVMAAEQKAPVGANPPLKLPVVVDRVRFFPAPHQSAAMAGGKFTGSNVSATEGFQPLATIAAAPAEGQWTDLPLENSKPYRWIRYEAPAGSHGNVAEVEFYSGQRKLGGQPFGSALGNWRAALDGKTDTFMNAAAPDGQYVGLDLGDLAATARPQIGNRIISSAQQEVTIRSASPDAVIRYTLDGGVPGPNDGTVYSNLLKIDQTSTFTAVAFKEGLAPSYPTSATFVIGAPRVINSFHVGNSLTGNAARFPTFARTAGIDSHFHTFLMGGALTVKLWKSKDTVEQKQWKAAFENVKEPFQFFTMQPRDFDLDEEVANEVNFLNVVREKSPDVQPWLYAEWVEMNRQRPSDKGTVPTYQMTRTFPALTWEESMSAMLLYVEEVQHRLNAVDKAGKRTRILPCSLAMGWARNLVDNNQLPGVPPGEASFYRTFFDDQVHVNPSGCYLVDLIWYAAFTGQSPVGKMLPVGTSLSSEQAKTLQNLAWDIVKNYPDCGLYEEGTTPVSQPQFSQPAGNLSAPTAIHLTSSTPGAFFRYTLDGTVPTRTRGYVYCGVITARPGMTVKAIAYKSGMADSPVAEAGYPEAK